MAVTLRASKEGLKKIDLARKKKGWKATAHAWCMVADTSPATLRRFRQGESIKQDTFVKICQAVGVNWEEIYDPNPPTQTDNAPLTQTSEIMWLLLLSANIREVDKPRAEAIVAFVNQLLGGGVEVILQRIDSGSVKLVLKSYLEGFERIEYLFKTGQLTEILGIPVQDVRLASAAEPVNWRQWLSNLLFEPYWQPPELILAMGGHRSARGSDEPEAIAKLLQLLQTSQDEPTRRKAAEALGQIGISNSNVINALSELLPNTQDEETRWQAALSLGKIDPSNPAAGVKRAKVINFWIPPDNHAVALIVAFKPDTDEEISIRLRVEPLDEQLSLPPKLKLAVLDESGNAVIETESTNTDNFLQRDFNGPPGEKFSVRLSLGDVSITEDFTI